MRLRQRLSAAVLIVVTAFAPTTFAARHGNVDAFLSHTASSHTPSSQEQAMRGVRISHEESRLGLPTFTWATRSHLGSISPAALESPAAAARAYVRELRDLYRLSDADVARLEEPLIHDEAVGPLIARFAQRVNGVEVFRSSLNVLMDRSLELVALSGYLAPSEMATRAEQTPVVSAFALPASDALARGAADLTGMDVPASAFLAQAQTEGGYATYSLEGVRTTEWGLSEPPRAKRVYFQLADRLEPAWYVELAVSFAGAADAVMFSFVYSAQDGALLMRNELTQDATYRVWADGATYLPHDGPQGTDATPHPTGLPDRYQAPFVGTNVVSLQNYPFSRNDPWLAPNATATVGNNVEAYADLAAPDGFQPATDLHAPANAPGTFDYTYDPTQAPGASVTQRHAAVVNLFYVNNFLHDWFYDVGFNEAWGNAQSFNYGRGGLEADSIKAEAQDYSGRNNANMSTPADGARPRMQMYVFDGVPSLSVQSPASVAGDVEANTAAFGDADFDVTLDLSILNPAGTTEGCTAFPAGTFTGKIALLDRGTCAFALKALNAQNAGALAVIIANNALNQPAPGMGGSDPTVTIPVLSTTKEAGDAWKAEVAANATTINVRMRRGPALDRDGTLDNDIVAHEWGHYISNRLIGNSNGLINLMGRGMGEGWSDTHALLMMVRDSDRSRPGNANFEGVYAVAGYTQSGGLNNGYYFGIRRVPYSTDFSKNALTFKHIQNGVPLPSHPAAYGQTGMSNAQVHATGEVWATMLWESYVRLLNAYPFQEAQDRWKAYLVAAYKMTPVAPTLLEARDALWAVAAASDPADYQRFVSAFARRGAGHGAMGPDRNAQDHIGVVESFEAGANLRVEGITLNDAATGCDQDGVLDVGEVGELTLTVRNVGGTSLSAFGGTVSASGATATVAFPQGNVISFPSLAPGAAATRTLQVQLVSTTGGAPGTAGLTIAFNEPSLPVSAQTASFDGAVHFDEEVSSATETFDAVTSLWDRSPTFGANQWKVGSGYAHAPDANGLSDVSFMTPWLEVNPSGDFIATVKYRHSFEATNGTSSPYYDGAVLEYSYDGVTWSDVFLTLGINPGYTAYLAKGQSPLSGRPAMVSLSAGFPAWASRTINFKTHFAGKKVRLRWRVGTDQAVGAYGMDLDSVAFTNLANTPFAVRTTEPSNGTICNRRPVAVLPTSLSSPEGTLSGQTLTRATIVLDGSGSYDPDGDPLTFQWTQVAGPAVTLTGGTSASASFTPDVPATLQYTFELVVSDGVDASAPRRVNVIISNVNRPPIAQAVAPATVAEGTVAPVTLDGSASSDADNEPLTYKWTQTAGPAVQLSADDVAQPTFPVPSVPQDTPLTFELVVNDGIANSAPVSVTVTVLNTNFPPTVSAGADQSVAGRSQVALTAVAGDPDGDVLAYTWVQTSGPAVTLTDANDAIASFTSPDVKAAAQLAFEVTVSDGALTATDTVVVDVAADSPPQVSAGSDRNTPSRALTVLYGAASDAEGDAITYAWTQTSGPTVILDDAAVATPTFVAPSVTTPTQLAFTLTATANGLSASDAVVITVQQEGMPTSDAGADQTVPGRTLVVVQGAGASADGSAVAYAWTQTQGPTVTLIGANTSALRFTSPDVKADTTLGFQLAVTAHGQTATDAVDILVQKDGMPVAMAGDDQNVDARAIVTLHGAGTDPENDAIAFAWTQVGGPTVALSDASAASPTFTAPDVTAAEPELLSFELVVSANGLSSAPDSVQILVHRANRLPVIAGQNEITENERTRLTLTLTATDADGDAVSTWHWEQTGGPTVALEGADKDTVAFTTPEVRGDLLITLAATATDAFGGKSEAATVRVLVKNVNRAPTVTIAPAEKVKAGEKAVLNGSATTDEDGDSLTYRWKQTGGPSVTLKDPEKPVATFIAPSFEKDTTLKFELVAADAAGEEGRNSVSITVSPAPTAGGCGCASSQSGWPSASLFVLLGFGLLGLRRRAVR